MTICKKTAFTVRMTYQELCRECRQPLTQDKNAKPMAHWHCTNEECGRYLVVVRVNV